MRTRVHTGPAAGRMPTTERMARRLSSILASADVGQVEAGRRWYPDAHALCLDIANRNALDVNAVAAVVAALSPRLRWSINVREAARLIEQGYTTGVLRANVAKAKRILAGDDPCDVLGGNKVCAFHKALSGDLSQVVVDAWAARGAGWPDKLRFDEGERYLRIEGAYREAAAASGVEPSEAQAIVWVVTRGTNL